MKVFQLNISNRWMLKVVANFFVLKFTINRNKIILIKLLIHEFTWIHLSDYELDNISIKINK